MERECAAALIVRTLQVNGDTWRPVGWPEIEQVFKADIEANREPWVLLVRNPFFRPDVHDLVKPQIDKDTGETFYYARWTEIEGGTVELTQRGIEALPRMAGATP